MQMACLFFLTEKFKKFLYGANAVSACSIYLACRRQFIGLFAAVAALLWSQFCVFITHFKKSCYNKKKNQLQKKVQSNKSVLNSKIYLRLQ